MSVATVQTLAFRAAAFVRAERAPSARATHAVPGCGSRRGRRASVVVRAASKSRAKSDEDQLSRALRTIDTGALMVSSSSISPSTASPSAPAPKKSYYQVIDGVRYDRKVLDDCRRYEAVDGGISLDEAKSIMMDIIDGPTKTTVRPDGRTVSTSVTNVEMDTAAYALREFNWTGPAREWFEREMETIDPSPAETPAEAPAEAPAAEAPAEVPAEASAEAPAEAPDEAPAEAPAEASAEAPDEAPVAPTEPADATSSTSAPSDDDASAYTLRGPEPQKFGVADGELANVLTASGSFVTRAVSGALCEGWNPSVVDGPAPEGVYTFGEFGGRYLRETSDVHKFSRPEKPIKLYEFEGCPFCRKVREAVIWLDLDVLFYPCPQGGPTYREFVKQTGGKSQFPYMVDENTGVSMYESDDIIDYLYDKYGPGKDKVPSLLRAGALTILTAGFGLAPRMGAGSRYVPAKAPEKPLRVWSYEASPFCKLVREKLVELELPHLMKSSGRGSPKRQELVDRRGTFQAPYLEDPNTGVAMFESAAIVKYLEETYGK